MSSSRLLSKYTSEKKMKTGSIACRGVAARAGEYTKKDRSTRLTFCQNTDTCKNYRSWMSSCMRTASERMKTGGNKNSSV